MTDTTKTEPAYQTAIREAADGAPRGEHTVTLTVAGVSVTSAPVPLPFRLDRLESIAGILAGEARGAAIDAGAIKAADDLNGLKWSATVEPAGHLAAKMADAEKPKRSTRRKAKADEAADSDTEAGDAGEGKADDGTPQAEPQD